MSYCLNPVCEKPQNLGQARFCQNCGLGLLLCDRYRALRPIGRGGFGRTFLAVDEHIPSKPTCVIKQFFPKDLGVLELEKATELFHQEAVRMEQLDQHPQIPKLLAHFDQSPYQYLIQTYVDGPNLEQELDLSGAFSEEQIRGVLNDLLPVLQFIHDRHVIHRDIKPANVIRRRNDEQLVLVDFGAAKVATGTALNRTGTSIGSAGYAAPEQIVGRAVFASDLYSLGVTCIHLLTDVPPFDLYSFSDGVWIWRDYLLSPVSDSLGYVLDRMLDPAISRRYASAAIALHALSPQPISLARLTVPLTLSPFQTTPRTATAPPVPTWKCLHTLHGHVNSVATVAVSPDGQLIATGSFDKTLKLWDWNGELRQNLKGHIAPVLSVAFSPDGETLVSGSVDDTIKLWNLDGELLSTLTEHADSVLSLSVAVSPDGQALVSGSDDCTVKIWQLTTGRLFRTLPHPRAVTSVAISPDGQILASSSNDNTIRLWNFGTGELLHTLVGHTRDVNSIAIAPNGNILISGGCDNTVRLWEMRTGQLLNTLTGHLDWIRAVAISPDGELIASGGGDHTVKIWETETGRLKRTLVGHTRDVNAIAFSPDSHLLISGSSDRTLKIWQRQKPIDQKPPNSKVDEG
ncbi:serine/threonine protein kinase [Leptolyngbya sp. FACHB-541]|uniref:serine/threonine-protein kinase n=1 Tax=Leptolyngbya sp. FACHB-541 TaxID=2692810 RepID=UPI0016824FFE|nr:serine/threonine-protein kinase [Leptolyngbya sp. FACHB-541]MBD2001016.1 serine/threonine protein kinase [Leptolyngbya sp. FACHB-541]